MAYVSTGRPNGRPRKPRRKAATSPETPSTETAFGLPPLPPFVKLGPVGRRAYEHLWRSIPYLDSTRGDGVLVAMVAAKVEEWSLIRAELDRLGSTTYVAPNGQTLTHPLVRQLNEAEVRLTSWLSALGCSPSDRSRLGPETLARGTTDELEAYRLRNRLRDLSRHVVEEFG